MKLNLPIVILSFVLLISLLLNFFLYSAIRYWNPSLLFFNTQYFNNLVTPIASIVAVIVYGWALFTSIQQNKIIYSQGQKPYFEKRIEQLNRLAEDTEIVFELRSPESYNMKTYFAGIIHLFIELSLDKDFQSDVKKFEKEEPKHASDLAGKSYFKSIFKLSSELFQRFSPARFFYSSVVNLVQEIKGSKLIEEDKNLLLREIYNGFFNTFYTYMKGQIDNPTHPKIPIIDIQTGDVDYSLVTDSPLRKYYNILFSDFEEFEENLI